MKYAGGTVRFIRLLPVFLLLAVIFYPQGINALTFPDDETGDSAMADRYALWSKNLIDDGYWSEALAALERSRDFADVSSDISYLLACARAHANRPRVTVLEALNVALAANRWILHNSEDARLFRAETLIGLKAYSEALQELSLVSRGPREALLTLKVMVFSRPWEFHRYMREILDRYPRECEPVRVFFDYLRAEDAAGNNPGRNDIELLELIMLRLPLLLPDDPELAWMAAPFMRDTVEAGRIVSAYRAANKPVIASLPAAIKLGLIDEAAAISELFAYAGPFDIALLGEMWGLLRRDAERAIFSRNLTVFSGVITEDTNGDGIPETITEYANGMLVKASYDTAQTGIPELVVFFEAGDPKRALALLPPDIQGAPTDWYNRNSGPPSRKEAVIKWERYPAVLESELDGVKYIPRPLNFYFSPLNFVELWGSRLLFPQRDPLNPAMTRRVLATSCLTVERNSLEFSSGKEVVELSEGIPIRAREYVGSLMVSETDFLRGRPQLQWVDLDFDGWMETVRYFSRNYRQMEIEELWDYDREYARVVRNER